MNHEANIHRSVGIQKLVFDVGSDHLGRMPLIYLATSAPKQAG